MTVPSRARAVERAPQPTYGWNAEGKSPEEIASDIRQTRYRLDAELRALREKVARIKWPVAAAAGLAALVVLIRKIRR